MKDTELMRRLLDERGIEHEDNVLDFGDGNINVYTEWGDDPSYSFVEYVDGSVLRIFGCIPEQAMAAVACVDPLLQRW